MIAVMIHEPKTEPKTFAEVIDALGGPAKTDKALRLKTGHAGA